MNIFQRILNRFGILIAFSASVLILTSITLWLGNILSLCF